MVLRALILIALVLCPGHARARSGVALQLVLAVDGSTSIVSDVFDFQLSGHAAAFRSPKVIDAITGSGGIAVTLVQWSNPGTLEIMVPWTTITSTTDAYRFATAIDALPRRPLQGSTGIGSALAASVGLFDSSPPRAPRRVIDIVSNGFNNIGIFPENVRDEIVARGITINGLVILDEHPWLADYFNQRVTGGPGSFVMVADGPKSFARAILNKLFLEIAGNR